MIRIQHGSLGALCGGFLLLWPLSAAAWPELDVHGSLGQGYVHSDGLEVFSGSEEGSARLNEVAVNVRSLVADRVLVSGQVLSRRAGDRSEGKLRLDYLQADYSQLLTDSLGLGLRAGRVKNPFGLYNSSRDVVFSRPGITTPKAVYFDDSTVRDLLFASDGAQLYGQILGARFVQDLVIGASDGSSLEDDLEESFGDFGALGRLQVSNFRLAQWMIQDISGQGFKGGLSYLGAKLSFEPTPSETPTFPATTLDSRIYVGSLQYRAASDVLTFEYRMNDQETTAFGQSESTRSEGAYVQWERLFSARLKTLMRYEWSVADRNDRSGRRASERSGQPRYTRFEKDWVLGINYLPDRHWGAFAELHLVDGTAQTQNSGQGEAERYWEVLYLMLAYRF